MNITVLIGCILWWYNELKPKKDYQKKYGEENGDEGLERIHLNDLNLRDK